MANLIIILGLVVGIISCGQEETSDGRFVTYGQQDRWSDRQGIGETFLISRVHEESWQIAWLIDNDTCHGFTPFQRDSLHSANNRIERVTEGIIREWLEPLADIAHSALVDEFQFVRLDADDLLPIIVKAELFEDDLTTEERQLIDELNSYEMAITFSCQRGEYGELGVAYDHGILLYEVQVTGGNDLSFQSGVLRHEVGHLFGLVDTYVRGNVHELESTGGSSANAGQQPDSVMSGSYSYQNMLGEDDKRGIQWLYRYYHDLGIKPDDCIFNDYQAEIIPSPKGNFRGCRPIAGVPPEPPRPVDPPPEPPIDKDNELIEPPERTEPRELSRRQRVELANQLLAKMRQQVAERELVQFINENPEFVVNRYDLNNGYTALHYALVSRHLEVVEILLDHPEIDVNRRAWNGDTPLHLATLEGYEDGIRALLAHPKIRVNAYKYINGGRRLYIRDYAIAGNLDWLVQEIDRRRRVGN